MRCRRMVTDSTEVSKRSNVDVDATISERNPDLIERTSRRAVLREVNVQEEGGRSETERRMISSRLNSEQSRSWHRGGDPRAVFSFVGRDSRSCTAYNGNKFFPMTRPRVLVVPAAETSIFFLPGSPSPSLFSIPGVIRRLRTADLSKSFTRNQPTILAISTNRERDSTEINWPGFIPTLLVAGDM